MGINIELGPLRFNDRHNESGDVSLHATNRELETRVSAYAGNEEEKREPFNTLEFETEGSRICLFLTDAQLDEIREAVKK